jgi:hypothetical protein
LLTVYGITADSIGPKGPTSPLLFSQRRQKYTVLPLSPSRSQSFTHRKPPVKKRMFRRFYLNDPFDQVNGPFIRLIAPYIQMYAPYIQITALFIQPDGLGNPPPAAPRHKAGTEDSIIW